MIGTNTHYYVLQSATTPVVVEQSNHGLSTAVGLQAAKSPLWRKPRGLPSSYIVSLLILSLFSFLLFQAPAKAGTWTSVGPHEGETPSIVVSPNYAADQTIFVAANNNVLKSTDGGVSWTADHMGLGGFYVYALCVSPNYAVDQAIFVGTAGGVFKSTDGGANWTAVITGLSVQSIGVSPNYSADQTVFAGTFGGGFFKSTDGGANWIALNAGLNNLYVSSIGVSPNYSADQTVFAGTFGDSVLKSTDGGANWTEVNIGTDLTVGFIAISPGYSVDQTVFAGTWSGGVYKSTDGGGSWSAVNTGLGLGFVKAISISPNYTTDQTIFAGIGDGFFKSINGGGSWVLVYAVQVDSIGISPGYSGDQTVFAGTFSGVFKSIDGGVDWTSVNAGLSVQSIAISPGYSADQTVFAGAAGGVYKSTDEGVSWARVNAIFGSLDVQSIGISPGYAFDQTFFFGTWSGGLFKSTDGGLSWTAVNTGLGSLNVYDIGISPSYSADQTIFTGTDGDGVLKSTDGGVSWEQVNAGLIGPSSLYVMSFGISPGYSTDQTIFAGTFGAGVFKSTDGGLSWIDANTGFGFGVTDVFELAISPNYAIDQTIFAGTYGTGVFKSTDGGGNWSAVNTGLGIGNIDVYSLAASPNYANDYTIFVGTRSGVFKSTDGGGNWTAINGGLGNLFVRSLSISPNYLLDGIVYAGTYGSSAWKYNDTVCSSMPEVCNGLDDNCNGQVDENLQNTYYQDADSDGYGNPVNSITACTASSGYISDNTDCDDSNPAINPNAVDIVGDGIDQNCSETTAIVSGTILIHGINMPVVGASVSVGNVIATTDSNGRYQLSLTSGTHQITASAQGYTSFSGTITISSFNALTYDTIYLKNIPWDAIGIPIDVGGYSYTGWEFAAGLNNTIYFATPNNSSTPQRFIAYDLTTNTYTEKNLAGNDLCACGATSQLIAANNKLYYFANSATVYDPQADTWSGVSYPPNNINGASIGVLGDDIYFIGGWGAGYLDTVHVYNTTTNSWRTVANYLYPTINSAVTSYNNKLYVLGGTEMPNNKMSVYDPATDSWTAMPDIPFANVASKAITYDNKIYLFGGTDIYVYDLITATWNSSILSVPESDGYGNFIPMLANNSFYIMTYSFNNSQFIISKLMPVNSTPVIDITAPTTTASPAGGTYKNTQTQYVKLICTDVSGSGCDKIYYTTDGSTPTTLSNIYTSPITISATTILKFFATDLAGNNESVKTETYTFATENDTTTIVSGTILRHSTTTPVVGATVTIGNITAITDNNGQYQLLLPAGTYEISATAQGYTTYTGTITITSFNAVTYKTISLKSIPWEAIDILPISSNWYTGFVAGLDNIIYIATPYYTLSPQRFIAYDLTTNTYTEKNLAGNNLCACGNPSQLIAANNKLYYFANGNGTVYDPQTDTWSGVSNPPNYINAAGVGVLGDDIYFIGGWGGPYLTTAQVYNTTTNTWRTIANYLYGTANPAVTSYNNKIYVLGGQATANKMSVYDPATDSWTALPDIPFADVNTWAFRAVTYDNKIYLFVNGETGIDIYVYDLLTSTWNTSILSAQVSDGYGNVIPVLANNSMYVISYSFSDYQYTISKFMQGNNNPSVDTTAPTTTASPVGGIYTDIQTQSVKLRCTDVSGSGCDQIYYTTDGSTPTISSNVYLSPIAVSATTTIKFFATDIAGNIEPVNTETYTLTSANNTNAIVIGTVLIQGSTLPVIGATVSVGNVSTTTNINGLYQLSLPPGTYDITASALRFTGYSGIITISSYNDVSYQTIYLKYMPWEATGVPINFGGYSYSGWEFIAGLNNTIYFATPLNSGMQQHFIAYDLTTNTYTEKNLAGNDLCACGYMSLLTAANNKLYYFANGGIGSGGGGEVYDPQTDMWSNANYPNPRGEAGVGVLGEDIYYIGGRGPLNTAQVYNTTTNSWRTIANYLYYTYFPAVTSYNNKIYVLGGQYTSNKMSVYDPATDSWTALPDIPFTEISPWSWPRAVTYDNKIYLYAWTDTGMNIYVYDLINSVWSDSILSMPSNDGYYTPLPVIANNSMYLLTYNGNTFDYTIYKFMPANNTPTGNNITISPLPDVNITFSSVATPGSTTITTSNSGNAPPSGFNLGNEPLYYDVTTTASFTGLIEVCFNYNEFNYVNENLLRLFHYNGSTWDDVTSTGYPDTVNNIICGLTSSLSPFVIAQENTQEICDGIDNNGNGLIDEGVQNTYYQDADGDTYGNVSVTTLGCTQPSGYVANSSDCNDSNASIKPGATEVCNGVDDNCNGQIDEGVQNTYYRDADADTYGIVSVTTLACTQPSGYVSNIYDCNDGNAYINPGAAEICNGVDDNCNAQTDEGVQNTYYRDADADTYGNVSVTTLACTQPIGYISNSSDCNDGNASINPAAAEVCNGLDDNCNGHVDEGVLNTYYRDTDTDTYGNVAVTTQSCSAPSGYVSNSTDCNDNNVSVNPGATEICNAIDDNCNGQVDEVCVGLIFLPPVTTEEARLFTLGSTIPVKFQLRDQNGGYLSTAAASIYLTEVTDSGVGPEIPGESSGNANVGNTFRYVSDDNLYIFNLSTRNLSSGLWQIRVSLDDGSEYTARVHLDKRVKVNFPTGIQDIAAIITTSSTGPALPSGFRQGSKPTFFDISPTTTFAGIAKVCIEYDGTNFNTERSLKLFHWNGSGWDNITTSLDTIANIICGNTTSFSPFIVAEQLSTAVTLSNLSAIADGDDVLLTWSTRSEADNEGFVVLRGENQNGPFSSVSSMIPAVGGLGMKAAYTFTDSNVGEGKTYYYRLQDVDSRGVVTSHNVIPVTTVVAGVEKPSQKIQDQKQDIHSIPQEVDQEIGQEIRKKSGSDSVVKAEFPPTLILPRKGGGDNDAANVSFPQGEGILDETVQLDANSVTERRPEKVNVPSVDHIITGSSNLAEGREKQFPDNHANEVSVSTSASASSSFSVTIEDEVGNLIRISKMNNVSNSDTSANELDVKEDTGKAVLTWQGVKPVKGFVIYRAEKGKKEYSPITSVIPYFGPYVGIGEKSVIQYRFIDNSVKPGVKYEYRIEVADSSNIAGKKPA